MSDSRKDIMLCYPFEEKRLSKWPLPICVQPKLDGIRCRAFVTSTSATLYSSTGEVITSVPHINEALSLNLPLNEYDGELYLHGMDFSEISSITSRTRNQHPDYKSIQYHIFDLVNTNPFIMRYSELDEIFSSCYSDPLGVPFCLQLVETYQAETLERIFELKNSLYSQGYEGIILRHFNRPYERKRSTGMMKFKPKKRDSYQIVSFIEETTVEGFPKNSLGALVCKGDDGTLFNVGTGFSREQRQELWLNRSNLPGLFCTVEYQHLSFGLGKPRFPVFVSITSTSFE